MISETIIIFHIPNIRTITTMILDRNVGIRNTQVKTELKHHNIWKKANRFSLN